MKKTAREKQYEAFSRAKVYAQTCKFTQAKIWLDRAISLHPLSELQKFNMRLLVGPEMFGEIAEG